jgi:hypothetical protein
MIEYKIQILLLSNLLFKLVNTKRLTIFNEIIHVNFLILKTMNLSI